MSHSWVLVVAYASACTLWWVLKSIVPLWPYTPPVRFAHPWRELLIALAAVIGVLMLGQLWQHGIRLKAEGWMDVVAESLNQILIFAPMILVPIVRRQPLASAWVRLDHLILRVAVGVGLALATLLIYSTLEQGAPSFVETLRSVYTPTRSHLAVQVLLEDLAIAILFVRLAGAIGPRKAVLGVAALFAAAHIPSVIAHGGNFSDLAGLVRDFGLGVLVLSTVQRSADIAWLWPVHYSLDMTQFVSAQSG